MWYYYYPCCRRGKGKLNHIFKKIYSALKTDRLYGNYYAGGFAYEFIVEYYRLANNKPSAEISDNGSSRKILAAVNYIDSHYKEEITLEQLCGASGVTKQHLCKLFRKNFRMTPVDYITILQGQALESTTGLPLLGELLIMMLSAAFPNMSLTMTVPMN